MNVQLVIKIKYMATKTFGWKGKCNDLAMGGWVENLEHGSMFTAESQYREKVESMPEKKDWNWSAVLNEASVVGFRAKVEALALYRNINFYNK